MGQRTDWAGDSSVKTNPFNQLCRDLANESRGCVVHITAVEASVFSVGNRQFFHGPGDTDIGQTTLFLEAAGLFQRHLVGKQVLLHAGNEHQWELETLGGVKRHHLNAVLIGVGLAFPCVERRTVKKRL